MQSVTCFLPCREGSQRIPRKNIKPFLGKKFGLIEIKLKQLIDVNLIDRIILSTNDREIIEYAESIRSPKIVLHRRDNRLASSETSTDDLVSHALELIPRGHILWTHVTSPFIDTDCYNSIIESYYSALRSGFDSLMTTTELHSFLWGSKKPINYDRNVEKWPQTQKLSGVHEVNSGAFIASSEIYQKFNDRIGERPYMHTLDKLTAHDIDWPEDFQLAECMLKEALVNI